VIRPALIALALALAAPAVAGPGVELAHAQQAAAQKKLKSKWLCGPRGPKSNPCHASQTTTVVQSSGATSTLRSGLARKPRVDCFYVYPTVSSQRGPNANLRLDPEVRAAAQTQASRFSSRCRVYAPLYRQVTLAALTNPSLNTKAARNRAYADVRRAWREYLANDNKGRGVVLIGHDQGAFMLTQLLKDEFDRKPSTRRLLVSAMLPGGNVVVPRGRKFNGDFRNIAPCRSDEQVRCVIAYSTYDSQPPRDAFVTRVSSTAFPRRPDSTKRVLCTNPSALVGGVGMLTPYFPSGTLPGPLSGMLPAQNVPAPWVAYPRLYTARCKGGQRATWLQVTPTKNAADPRPRVQATLGPRWGFHLADVNLALGQLVRLVGSQTDAYAKQVRAERRRQPTSKKESSQG